MPHNINFLFRFRDLVASTIAEHKTTIADLGFAWWGWWMRPSEGPRDDIWRPLRASLPVTVGLFDSGNGRVYRARVGDVIRPVLDEAGECSKVGVPAGQERHIPGYYRDSPFSRAWLKIESIDEFSANDFFGRFSFDGPPALSLTPSMVNEYQDKVVLNAKELRWMDTTIWKVRPRRTGDKEVELLALGAPATAPLMNSPILTRGDSILYLSDPHFARGDHRGQHSWRLESEPNDGRATLAEALSQAISTKNLKIGMMVVSGDLTFLGSGDEFDEARRGLSRLFGTLNLEKQHVVVVPGNHDIKWTNADIYKHDSPVTNAPDAATANYRRFYGDFLVHDAHQNLSMARRYVFPSGMVLDFGGLNSSTLERGGKFLAGAGKINEQSLQEIAVALNWRERGPSLRIVCLHHHVAQVFDVESPNDYYEGFGMCLDGPKIQRLLVKNGVQLAIHGHQHQPFVWRSNVYELPDGPLKSVQGATLSILGGGSAGSKSVPRGRYFNIITVEAKGLRVSQFICQTAGGSFELASTVFAAFEFNEGILSLAEWVVVNS